MSMRRTSHKEAVNQLVGTVCHCIMFNQRVIDLYILATGLVYKAVKGTIEHGGQGWSSNCVQLTSCIHQCVCVCVCPLDICKDESR